MYTFSYNYIVDEIGLYSLILFTYIIIISIDLLFIIYLCFQVLLRLRGKNGFGPGDYCM